MSATISWEPVLEAGVQEFLKRHGGEAALAKACEVARACFPEILGIKVWLLEDPDEDNHTWVMLRGTVPASYPPELLQAHLGRFHEDLARQLPLPYHPFTFGLWVDADQE